MSASRLQIIVISSAVVIAVGLFLAPSQVNIKPGNDKHHDHETVNAGFDREQLLKSARQALDKEKQSQLDFLESGLKQKEGDRDTAVLDQLGRFWDRQSIPAAAAIWFEKKAEVMKTERSYLDAAYRYFDSFKLAQDSSLRGLLVDKAITNYEKVVEINPGNLDAKTDLGACYAEGTAEPMKGIMLLRDVIASNPNHEMAQYNLGMLSVRSGQLDKAIERFNKVLEINPKRTDIFLFLGQVYLQKGDTVQAIANYKSFVQKTDDYQTATQVGKIVEELNHSSVN